MPISISTVKSRTAIRLALLVAVQAGALAFTYEVAHRSGRGATCFEVATHTKDQSGMSLRTAVMARHGTTWEYSYWGSDCTISVVHSETQESLGHWRYVVASATLYADDEVAERVFPASGRWQPVPRAAEK